MTLYNHDLSTLFLGYLSSLLQNPFSQAMIKNCSHLFALKAFDIGLNF